MARLPPNLYEQWRAQRLSAACLRERDGWPPEKLLQQIWRHQRLRRQELLTRQGEPVRVLHPGFWNQEPGPDFKNAVIQIGTRPPVSGDVEIDLSPSGWKQHGHATNPAYLKVVLHVVWDSSTEPASSLPTLSLEQRLDASLEELASALGTEGEPLTPGNARGQCSAPLKTLSGPDRAELLTQAAGVRLRIKAGALQAQARQSGWEQALWEGVFAALGYKNNSWPMRRLAELLPCLAQQKGGERLDSRFWQARLFGVANLLPPELTRAQKETDLYLKELWNQWWRERSQFDTFTLPKTVWRFAGLRPANHPQRRVALAAQWVSRRELPQALERWAAAEIPSAELVSSLAQVLRTEDDTYWSTHWTFRSKPMSKKQPLLGEQRLSDLAINVILPWLWVRAEAGQNATLRARMESRYFSWPASEDNAVLKLARQRLLGGASASDFRTAASQQGLLQITRDFCDHSNAICENCPFPGLVRGIAMASPR